MWDSVDPTGHSVSALALKCSSDSTAEAAPDFTHKILVTTSSALKPSVVPTNSAFVAHNANILKKRTLHESSDVTPAESATKLRAVEPRPICEAAPTIGDRDDCLTYQSKVGCSYPNCKYRHIDPPIGSKAWHVLRRILRIMNVNRVGDLEPRLYLGLSSFTLSDAERTAVDETRTIVTYCYRSCFTLGCYNASKCLYCHELPIEDCQEWELFKVGLARVARRNMADNQGMKFALHIRARGLKIAGALTAELPIVPAVLTKTDPCIYYFTTHGCWSPSCPYSHARPEVGSTEWKRLREKIERMMCFPVNINKFYTFNPIGYLGMVTGFKTHVEGPSRFPQRKLVEYCLTSFTTLGCPAFQCIRCHDLPDASSGDWGYLKGALLIEISRRKLTDDPHFDVLPAIKARGVTIRPSITAEDRSSSSSSSSTQQASVPVVTPAGLPLSAPVHGRRDLSIVPCLHYFSTLGCGKGKSCPMLHLSSLQPTGSPEWRDLRLKLEEESRHAYNTGHLWPLPGLDMLRGFVMPDAPATYEAISEVHCFPSFTTRGCRMVQCDRSHQLPAEDSREWLQFTAAFRKYLLDLPHGRELVVTDELRRRGFTGIDSPSLSSSNNHGNSYINTSNDGYGPCIRYHSIGGCPHIPCKFLHITYTIASADWIYTRQHLCNVAAKFPNKCILIPKAYLGLGIGYTDLKTNSDKGHNYDLDDGNTFNTLVTYCKKSFTKQGCKYDSNTCTQCHDTPLYGTLEHTNLKAQIIAYIDKNPGLEMSEQTRQIFNISTNTSNKSSNNDTEASNIVADNDIDMMYTLDKQVKISAEARKISSTEKPGSATKIMIKSETNSNSNNTNSYSYNTNRSNMSHSNNEVNIKIETGTDDFMGIRAKLLQFAAHTPTDTILPVAHIDTNRMPTSSTLSTLHTGDSIGVDVVESTAKHTTTALVRAVAFTVKGIDKVEHKDTPDEVKSRGEPVVSYWTDAAASSMISPILDRLRSPASAGRTTAAEEEPPGRSPATSKTARVSRTVTSGTSLNGPCVFFQSEYDCSRQCDRDHLKPEVGSEAWLDLRHDLKRCVKHIKCRPSMVPRVYLGLTKGFMDPSRDADEPLVDYCYRSFTTLGCPCEGTARDCPRYHYLPVEGSSEWTLLKKQLIAYLDKRLDRDPDLDFTSQVKRRGLTKARASPTISYQPCFWYYTDEGCRRLKCTFAHDRPRIGSPEWYSLRQALIEHVRSRRIDSSVLQEMQTARPCAYLGFPSFDRVVLGELLGDDKAMVKFCAPRFTTKGCDSIDCKLCHEFPLPSSNEGRALQARIKAYLDFYPTAQSLNLRV